VRKLNYAYIYVCTVKPYGILKLKNASVKCVYCVTEGAIQVTGRSE
jgi:hypothetical protein